MTPAAWIDWLGRTSLDVTVLVVLVLLVQKLGRRWLTPRYSYALWVLVVIRLVLPDLPAIPGGRPTIALRESTISEETADAGIGRVGSAGRAARESAPPLISTPIGPESTPIEPRSDRAVPSFANAAAIPRALSSTVGPSWHWTELLGGVWLLGAVLLFARFATQEFRFRRRLRSAPAVHDTTLRSQVREAGRAVGLSREVEILTTDLVSVPAVTGLWRPRLLWPRALAGRFSDQELRNILLHELLHLRRRDVTVNGALTVLGCLHWFNPVVWFALARLRDARETLRDWEAMRADPRIEPSCYAGTLLKLVEICSCHHRPSPVVGFLRGRGDAKRRIVMIQSFKTSRLRHAFVGAALLLLLGWASLTTAESPDRALTTDSKKLAEIAVVSQAALPEWHQQIAAKLRMPLKSRLALEDVPINEALGAIAQMTGLNIILAPDLQSEGDFPLATITVEETRLDHVLQQLLAPFDLAFAPYRGVLYVGPRGEVPQVFTLRFYQISPLLEEAGDWREAGDYLIDLVREVIEENDCWDTDDARLYYYNGLLCVSQTDRIHERIHAFLNLLLNRGNAPERVTPAWRIELDERLAKTTNIEVEEIPLADAARLVAESHDVPVIVSADHAEDTLSLELRSVPLRVVLDWMAALAEVECVARDGALYLEEARAAEIRVHDVRDLFEMAHEGTDEARDELHELIQSAVMPASWERDGADIHFYGDLMVAVQTEAVHASIGTFLRSLREALEK